jgi:hypothetical protein
MQNVPVPTPEPPKPDTNRAGADRTAGAATTIKPVAANTTPAVALGFAWAELTIYDRI